jgi:alanyl-tRNA synthetase
MSERPVRSSEIRSAFLEFFRSRDHEIVPSGPLVPQNDPTLYFANSGMVQFKDVFTGREQRPYRRAASSQKCMRVSGKHNDLENVGPSPNHHTLFEMLGNFSFGDYFKEQAITYGWQFVTEVLGLPAERLATTYLRGDVQLPADTEARELWRRIAGLPEERIIGCGPEDNFWRMGDTGPCGPSSEIFYWKGDGPVDIGRFGQDAAPDGSGWVEIWNLVFMQFERKSDGTLEPLPAPSVDTGMGLERVTCIQQGKTSGYDTDLLRPLVDKVATIAGKPYGASMSADDISMRVIADHARATAFLIADGVLPDRAGRAYVLRRVMRRAIRHGHRLGIERPFLHEVALEVVRLLGDHYTELRERRDLIASVAEQEEVRFRETIERGLGLLEQAFEAMAARGERVLPGEDAFRLYDTYGFPLDLTQVICGERGYEVDAAGYEQALDEARKRSEFKGAEQAVESVYRAALARVDKGRVEFTGYERDEDSSEVSALIGDGALVERLGEGARGEIVTNRTPFYGEAGGQVGDRGVIRFAEGVFLVEDTQKPLDGLVVHRGVVQSGAISVGSSATLSVDSALRNATRRNHSATHLLHYALRKVVGPQAQQKGSLVGPDRLRFDFTHGSGLTDAQLGAIEDTVNALVVENHAVRTQVLPLDQARSLGAMMIFEEKYGSTVRMLTMGPSTELCGGTHARATGDIGLFKILQEQGVAAGIRRIVATTGLGSLAYVRSLEETLARASRAAKAGGTDLVEKIERLVAQLKTQEHRLEEAQRRWMQGNGGGADSLVSAARDVGGVRVLGVKTEVTDRSALRELAEQLRDKLGDSVVLIASEHEGKVQLVLTVAKGLTGRYKAGEMIRGIAQLVGGSGGGRPDLAQAGGSDVSKLDEAVAAIYDAVAGAAAEARNPPGALTSQALGHS